MRKADVTGLLVGAALQAAAFPARADLPDYRFVVVDVDARTVGESGADWETLSAFVALEKACAGSGAREIFETLERAVHHVYYGVWNAKAADTFVREAEAALRVEPILGEDVTRHNHIRFTLLPAASAQPHQAGMHRLGGRAIRRQRRALL